jgi:hypothetical protein
MKQVIEVPISMYEYIVKMITSQDFQQKTNMVVSVTLELYRVMISSLLIIFVPQNCKDHICSLMENLDSDNIRYSTGLYINYITFCAFIIMYICEMRREEKLIKLLEVNNTISTDNQAVGKRLEMFSEEKQKKLFDIDNYYQYASYLAMCIYCVNIILSGIVINKYSLGNQTLIIFLTNILFMISKLSNVYIIINTEKNIFFSAYLNTKVQFNDIDPREIKKIQRRRTLDALNRNISETGGWNLLENKKIILLPEGGFEFISSSDSEGEVIQEADSNKMEISQFDSINLSK